MYILAFVFSKKTINTYLKLKIRVACREFLAFEYVDIVFFQNKTDDYLYLCIRNLAFKTGFSVNNINLYLCWQVDDTKWILCCQKIGVKYAYLRFLMYKYDFFLLLLKFE